MGRKGGKAFLDTLRVANVAVYLVEHGKRCPFRGHEQAAHRHHTKQPDHFERDRFTARIRSADEQETIVFSKRQTDGYDLFPIDERMSAHLDGNDAVAVDFGVYATELICIFRACVRAVYLLQKSDIFRQLVADKTRATRKLAQNTLYFFLFVYRQRTEFIVHFQHFFWLDEKGRAACRAVVDKTFDIAFIFRTDGQDVSVVAHRYDAVL